MSYTYRCFSGTTDATLASQAASDDKDGREIHRLSTFRTTLGWLYIFAVVPATFAAFAAAILWGTL